MTLARRNLYVVRPGWSSRQAVTCKYRCGDACNHSVSNTSSGEYFRDVVAGAISRRQLLRGLVVVTAGGAAVAGCARLENTAAGQPGMNFTAVAPNVDDVVVIPDGYQQQVVIRWGDPVVAGAPTFDVNAQTADAQRRQFGFNNDFAALLAVPGTPGHFLLVVNHEYTSEPFMFPGYDADKPTREQFEIAVAAHGLSVVEVRREPGAGLVPAPGRYNRRITADTPMTLTGPGAGIPAVRTAADPAGRTVLGTISNCGGGVTPCGTVLTEEENFHVYFGALADADAQDPVAAARLTRYGAKSTVSYRKWEMFDPRFDLVLTPNEINRFGYVVEVNPFDPDSVPVKHTALGRAKHEAANLYVTGDGTVVSYSGDDERFEYLYKFVSAKPMRDRTDPASVAYNMTLLDEGTLYVAKLSGDPSDDNGAAPSGRGTWIPLLRSGPDGRGESLVPDMTAEDVAVFTRMAGDKVGATKMDRPEDVEACPKTGKIYGSLTNDSERGLPGQPPVDAANPRVENKNGQVIEIVDDHAGTTFTWSLLLVCGDPAAADTYYGGFDKSKVSPISCPDNLAFDSHGNLWVATDGNALDSNDGLFAVALDGDRRGETKQFLTVPRGAETCGPVVTDDLITVSVQHPGESDDHSIDNPFSHWPDGGNAPARPSVVAVWKAGAHIGE